MALLGPIFYRLLLSGSTLDRNLGTRLVDGILRGLCAASSSRAAAAAHEGSLLR